MGRARECLRTHVFAGSLHVSRDSDQCALRSSSGQVVSYQRGRSSRTNIRVPRVPIQRVTARTAPAPWTPMKTTWHTGHVAILFPYLQKLASAYAKSFSPEKSTPTSLNPHRRTNLKCGQSSRNVLSYEYNEILETQPCRNSVRQGSHNTGTFQDRSPLWIWG